MYIVVPLCLFVDYCLNLLFTLCLFYFFSPPFFHSHFPLFMANYKMITETLCLFAQLSLFDVSVHDARQKRFTLGEAKERTFYVDEMISLYDDGTMHIFYIWFVLLNQDICIFSCRPYSPPSPTLFPRCIIVVKALVEMHSDCAQTRTG